MQSPSLVPARRDEGGVGEGDPETTTHSITNLVAPKREGEKHDPEKPPRLYKPD